MFSNYNEYGKISDKRVVLLQSGGLDSNICSAILKYYGFEIHHVFVDYGQNSVSKERETARKVVNKYGGTLHECSIYLPWLSESCDLVNGSVDDWDDENRPLGAVESGTYVPMRNAMLLSIASSLAESLKIPYICAAFDGGEDCDGRPLGGTSDKHPSFVRKIEDSLNEGSSFYHADGERFTILTPLMDCFKHESIQIGEKFFADMSISWSCYNSDEVPCCRCSACRARAEGFYRAGIKDPLLEKFGITISEKDLNI